MATTTLDGLLALGDLGIIAIADISVGELLTSWTLTATRTYTYECTPTQRLTIHGPKEYHRVLLDGATDSLTLQSSIATVEANPGSFWWDTATRKLYVHTTDSSAIWAHTIVADFNLYLSSGHYRIGSGVYLNSCLYWPGIQGVSTIYREIADIFEPRIITSSCELFLTYGQTWRNIFRAYRWTNRDVVIRVGGEDLPYSEYEPVFTGITRDRRWTDAGVTLQLDDKTVLFKTAFPPRKIVEEDVTRTYTITYPGAPGAVANYPTGAIRTSVVPNVDINTDALTENAQLGDVVPFIFGRDLYIVPPLLAADNGLGVLVGYGTSFVSDMYLENAAGTAFSFYTWDGGTGGSPFADSLVGIDAEYGFATVAGDILDDRLYYVVASGPAETDYATFPEGPVQEMAVDAAIYASDLCDIGITWDTTTAAESRFLTSLMECQVFETAPEQTLGDFLARLGASTASVVYQANGGEMVFRTLSPDFRDAIDLDEAWGDFFELDSQVDPAYVYTAVEVNYGRHTMPPVSATSGRPPPTKFTATSDCPEFAAEIASGATKSIETTYLKTEAGAKCLANRMARWGANEPQRLRVGTKFRHMQVDIGQNVRFLRPTAGLPIADDTYTLYGTVVAVGIDLGTAKVFLDVIERFQDRQAYIGAASSPAWGSATAAQRRALGFLTDADGLATAGNNAAFMISLEW